MNPEPITKIEGTYAEAPASWNTSYITQDGFVCRITLRVRPARTCWIRPVWHWPT